MCLCQLMVIEDVTASHPYISTDYRIIRALWGTSDYDSINIAFVVQKTHDTLRLPHSYYITKQVILGSTI